MPSLLSMDLAQVVLSLTGPPVSCSSPGSCAITTCLAAAITTNEVIFSPFLCSFLGAVHSFNKI